VAETLSLADAIARGLEHHRAGRLTDAERIYREILSQVPNEPDVLHLLGLLAHQVGRFDAAIDLISKAIAINPNRPNFYDDLVNALRAHGRPMEQSAPAVLQTSPTLNNLANALESTGQTKPAIACYQRALNLNPQSPEIQSNLAKSLQAAGRGDEALALYHSALSANPDLPQANLNLATLLATRLDQITAHRLLRKALELKPDYRLAHDQLLMMMHYQGEPPQTPDAIFQEHQHWNARHARPIAAQIGPHVNDRSPERPLRVGYISPDFRRQSVNFFIQALLDHHDRARFHITCYADELSADDVTSRLRALAGAWRNIRGLSDADVAEIVRQDGIDLLIDLAGHTGHNRLLVFARKPAPVQVSFLGYPDTTGLETMDYRLTDALADPIGQTERFHTETLLRIDPCAWCYTPPPESLDLSPPLESPEKTNIVFGSFNWIFKITPRVVEAWANILTNVEGSKLLIKSMGLHDPGTRRSLTEHFSRYGIHSDRIEMLGRVNSFTDHLRIYQTIDIALDTFPYNGTTTTCEATWMGVPVVAVEGNTHASRVGISLLNAVGLTELVAKNTDEYVEIAASLANDRLRLRELKHGMRDRMKASPLLDARGYARKVEQAYQAMWRAWCERRSQV